MVAKSTNPSALRTLLLTLLGALVLLGSVGSPLWAHKKHKNQVAAQAAAAHQTQASASGRVVPDRQHAKMGTMTVPEQQSPSAGFSARLLDWLGRFHPILVHFPIAFFPAALFTAVVGRRRPGFATPVQFLVVAGGIIAPISALLGWFNGGFSLSDTDPLMMTHRWLGTAIGAGGFALGIWAWRRPWEDRGAGMIAALTAMTIAIAVQGWFGGALVHGVEHLSW